MKVSVVVPAYNGGEYIDACVRSLRDQSMAADDYEVVYVNDGSTDGTGERLDRAAAEQDNVRVVHIDNTGGPGGPRNIGLDLARGEYVYFLDCDDWLGPEALERMYAMARRASSDVLIGRLVGTGGRGAPRAMFRHDRERADVLEHRLLNLLTPHKLFRTAFLREHGIRFPEGPVRLEDHRFVMRAYLQAEVISVLGSYPCCYWVKRADEGNYSSTRFDPVHYYGALAEVLDIVDEHVEPGPVRDRYYAHWLRGKMMRRMGGGLFTRYPAEYREQIYTVVRDLMVERFHPGVDRLLPAHLRPRAALMRAGAYDDLVALAEAERGITTAVTLDASGGEDPESGALTLRVSGTVVYRDGSPVRFRREGGRVFWEPPISFDADVPAEAFDVTDAMSHSWIEVVVRERESRLSIAVPTTRLALDLSDDPECGRNGTTVELVGEARLHAPTAYHGAPMTAGEWAVRVHMGVCGWGLERRVAGVHLAVGADGAAELQVEPDARSQLTPFDLLRQTARRTPGVRQALELVRSAGSQRTS